VIESVRPAGARLLATVRGVTDRDRAAELVGGELLVGAERLPDPGAGVAYAYQIVGLEVRTDDGRALGTVAEVIAMGGNTLYVVRGARELMIPAVPEVVRRVDLEAGVITVTLPAGLEDL
jgi:16S rRNA processing protein RimM